MSSMTFVPQQSITKRKTFQLEIEKNEVLGNYAIKSAKKIIIERKTVLFRSITRFWDLKKPRYLENRVVREPRKRRSACII